MIALMFCSIRTRPKKEMKYPNIGVGGEGGGISQALNKESQFTELYRKYLILAEVFFK